jgi:uncharacterized membrane protein YfcA
MIEIPYADAGALTGLVVGLTGVGGGALMTPILLLFFGVSPTVAIATDLWFAVITKLAGACVHQQGSRVDWQVVRRLWAGSLPIAVLVALYASSVHQIAKLDWLSRAVGVMVTITAVGLLLSPRLQSMARKRRLEQPDRFKATQPGLTVLAGAVLGLCVALTSVGAGALGSVLLLYLYPLRMAPQRLVATDLVHAIPLAAVAGTGYLIAGLVDWKMLFSLLSGSIPGILVGSLLANRVPARSLQMFVAVVLFAVGAMILF